MYVLIGKTFIAGAPQVVMHIIIVVTLCELLPIVTMYTIPMWPEGVWYNYFKAYYGNASSLTLGACAAGLR